jgi:hypothetical protein
LLRLLLLRLGFPVSLILPHGTAGTTHSCTDGSSLARVPSDRSTDGAKGSAPACPAYRTTARLLGGLTGGGRGLRGVEAGLLHRPLVALIFVLILLFLGLALSRVYEHLSLSCRNLYQGPSYEEGTCEQNNRSHDHPHCFILLLFPHGVTSCSIYVN